MCADCFLLLQAGTGVCGSDLQHWDVCEHQAATGIMVGICFHGGLCGVCREHGCVCNLGGTVWDIPPLACPPGGHYSLVNILPRTPFTGEHCPILCMLSIPGQYSLGV